MVCGVAAPTALVMHKMVEFSPQQRDPKSEVSRAASTYGNYPALSDVIVALSSMYQGNLL